jgi:hypothetical protein
MFTAYPTYSMAILWNMNAHDLNDAARALPECAAPSIPVDGDARARSAARRPRTATAWQTLRRECLELLENNHHECNKVDR